MHPPTSPCPTLSAAEAEPISKGSDITRWKLLCRIYLATSGKGSLLSQLPWLLLSSHNWQSTMASPDQIDQHRNFVCYSLSGRHVSMLRMHLRHNCVLRQCLIIICMHMTRALSFILPLTFNLELYHGLHRLCGTYKWSGYKLWKFLPWNILFWKLLYWFNMCGWPLQVFKQPKPRPVHLLG